MVRANRPFEYLHMDFMDMPDTVDGMKYLLVITDDFSLTTVLVPCKRANTEAVVKALLEH